MGYEIVRTGTEIDELLYDCVEAADAGATKVPGMTYEQGIEYALRWLTNLDEPHPLED